MSTISNIVVISIVDLMCSIVFVKCINFDNLYTSDEKVYEEYDPSKYVATLQSDYVDQVKMEKKPYKESKMLDYFGEYISLHNKHYESGHVFNYHLEVFTNNVKMINKLNEIFKGITVYQINEYTDITFENFTKFHTGFDYERMKAEPVRVQLHITPRGWEMYRNSIDTTLDRREDERHFFIEKNQGNCSNSYVFAAVRQLELAYRMQVSDYKLRLALSEQHAFDCTPEGDCEKGGVTGIVLKALKDTGIMMIDDYKYNETHPSKGACRFDGSKFRVKYKEVREFHVFENITEDNLILLIVSRGAFATAMYVPPAFQHYKAGIFVPTECDGQKPNFMVVVSGFGLSGNIKFWAGYTSWGFTWGDYSRFRIIRGMYACEITKEYVTYGLLFDDVIPPDTPFVASSREPSSDLNTPTTTSFTREPTNFPTAQTTTENTTNFYYQYFTPSYPQMQFHLNSSFFTSKKLSTEEPYVATVDYETAVYKRPRAEAELQKSYSQLKEVTVDYEKWFRKRPTTTPTTRREEILDSEYLRTSTVLSTPASWEHNPNNNYDAMAGVASANEDSDSFYVP